MSQIEILRVFVNERLTAATEEIFGVVGRIIGEYEDEVSHYKQKLERLNVFLHPEIRLRRIDDLQHRPVDVPPEHHEQTGSHKVPEGPIQCNVSEFKEEEEEFLTSQEGFGLQWAEDAYNQASSLFPADYTHDQPTSSHVNQSQGDGWPLPSVSTEGQMTDAWEVPEPVPSSDDGSGAQSDAGEEESSCSPGQKDQGLGTSSRCRLSKDHYEHVCQRRRRIHLTRTVTLRISVLLYPHISALSIPVSRDCPVRKLKVPYGLQEAEFLMLLRSSFPQLADKPFDVLKTDRRRRLCPLKLDKLTPEQIIRSADLGRSALYIRLKENPEDFRTSAMSVQLQQPRGAMNEVSEQDSSPSLPWGKQDSSPSLPWGKQDSSPSLPWGKQDSSPSLALVKQDSSPSLALAKQDSSPSLPWGKQDSSLPWGKQDSSPSLALVKQDSSLALVKQDSSPSLALVKQDSSPSLPWGKQDSSPSLALVKQDSSLPWGKQDSSIPWGKPGDGALARFQCFERHTKRARQCILRICVLADPDINVLTAAVSRDCPVRKLTVPYGLHEAEFLKLLRSSFPQLADKPFDVLKTDRRRRLCPLELDKLTPERIRSSDLGCSALYIRLKVD